MDCSRMNNLCYLSGKSEIEIFKNFYKAKGRELRVEIEKMELSSKDDEKSALLAHESDQDFENDNYFTGLANLSQSLLHATYNSEAYAVALYKRSAIYFTVQKYENCANDLTLCLEADYPVTEKPKLYIEKANCYAKMRNLKEMLDTIEECYNFMKNCPEISKDLRDEYLKEIKTFMNLNDFDLVGTEQNYRRRLQTVDIEKPHALNPNVSSSINFKYNNNTSETDYVAARDIPCGEVLFLDAAYAHGIASGDGADLGVFYCDYCLVEAKNCIPCRTCITLLYCSENCRFNAWNDYHQWECDIFRAQFLPIGMILSIRTVIRAACSGVIKEIISKKAIKPGRTSDPYLTLYSINVDFANLRSKKHIDTLLACCQNAVFVVEFLKKSNFISHLTSSTLYKLSSDALVDIVGGLLLRHNIQVLQRSITVNRASSIIASLNESLQKLVLSCMRIKKFNAFCPIVSGVPYSCLPNTIIDFHGYTAVVQASKDIKAGERIYRSTLNLSPNITSTSRKQILEEWLAIICKCESCIDGKKNCDYYNTFICSGCGGHAVLEEITDLYVECLDCKYKTCATVIKQHLEKYNLALESEDLSIKLDFLEDLKSIANPSHEFMYQMYRGILQLRSLKGNISEFRTVVEDFKICSKTKNQHGDPYDHLCDIMFICQAIFEFLLINKGKIKGREGMGLMNILPGLIKEANEISVVTFPPMLLILVPLEVYLKKYRIVNVYLKL